MSKVAVLITDMFEDSEYSQPAEAFKKAGHELIHVGLKSGVTVKGEKQGTPVKVDKAAQVLKGRKITGWKSLIQDIKNAGAEFIDQEVVEDGNLISSRSPADLPAFIRACSKKL